MFSIKSVYITVPHESHNTIPCVLASMVHVALTQITAQYHIQIDYEPAVLTVHPPPRMIEGGFIFFVRVSSVSKIFSSKKKWIL